MENMDEKNIPEIENEVENEEVEKKTDWKKELLDWVFSIVIAVVIAMVLRNFVLTLVKVSGASMEPTLYDGDRLYVNKLFYEPERGDVIIFEPAQDPNRPYVKRVIAIEGDTVYIDFANSEIYVNGELIEEDYTQGPTSNPEGYFSRLILEGEYDEEHPVVIPEGYVFALGDHRDNSRDSRDLGPIPEEEIMGEAVFRFWPLNDMGTL